MDLYGRRRNKNNWLNEYQWEEFMSLEDISGDFNLDKFANTYFVGSRGGHRNKLKLIQKKIVINFTPSLSNKPTSRMYPEYCKLSLVCYKPWVGDYPYQDTDDDIVVQEWKTFISEMQQPPDHLMQEY